MTRFDLLFSFNFIFAFKVFTYNTGGRANEWNIRNIGQIQEIFLYFINAQNAIFSWRNWKMTEFSNQWFLISRQLRNVEQTIALRDVVNQTLIDNLFK